MEWYARNKRAMPWRGTRDAYCVWVSEVMLQQTRVAAVEPYYRRFVRRFPTLRALARARSEEVLRLWAGLGYYSRARNLHRAANEIVAMHGGKFPRELEAALALPGVGRYTAAAVLSIAYGEPLAVVDGNVARVVARLGAVRGELRDAGRWQKLEERAQELMGESGEWPFGFAQGKRVTSGEAGRQEEVRKRGREEGKDTAGAARAHAKALHAGWRRKPFGVAQARVPALLAGDWNQAMMELGATVCTPRAPRCGECPVAQWCRARKLGIVEEIPAARKKRETEKMEIAAAVLVDERGRTLLVKPEKSETNGLFSGMWQFPAVEIHGDAARELGRLLRGLRVASKQEKEEGRKRGKEEGEKQRPSMELGVVRHTVTYREITLRPIVVRVRELPATKGGRTVRLAKVGEMAVSSATKKIARAAMGAVQARSMSAWKRG